MTEPEWDVEAIPDDPAFTHAVGFSDFIAHEREDLVDQAASFLNGLDGVGEAIHQDRELIMVSSALDTAVLSDHFGRWWDTVRQSDPPWEELLKRHSAAAHAVLKPAGYKKRTHTFNRQTGDDVWHVIELRRLDDATGRIDIGIYVDGVNELIGRGGPRPSWIGEPHCHIRDPLGGRIEFDLRGDGSTVTAMLEGDLLPALSELETRPQLRAAAGDGTKKLGMHRPANVVMAALIAMDGDLGVAQGVMQEAFEAANRQARPGIRGIAERIGLEPLTTGVDPTLTVQDEQILAAWTADQPNRLAALQRLVDANPPSRRRLSVVGKGPHIDLSTGRYSLPALWRWLVQHTPRIDELIPDPAPLPGRYSWSSMVEPTDAQRHLAELLATVMFDIVSREVPGVSWGFDMNGQLAIQGSRAEDILNRGRQLVIWLLDPPDTVARPDRANMLEGRIDWLAERLA